MDSLKAFFVLNINSRVIFDDFFYEIKFAIESNDETKHAANVNGFVWNRDAALNMLATSIKFHKINGLLFNDNYLYLGKNNLIVSAVNKAILRIIKYNER